jgi:hypothetical protein
MSMNVVWILTGVVMIVGFVALVSYFAKGGKNPGMPTTKQYDTQDAPPPDSEA